MEIDVHFHDIEKLVEEIKPKRVVDRQPVHVWREHGDYEENTYFADFFHALVALMKEHGPLPCTAREPGDAGDVVDDGRLRHELPGGQHPPYELD